MAIGRSVLRQCTRLPLVAAPVLIALAAAIWLHALPTHQPAVLIEGWPADGTQFFAEPSRVRTGLYSLAPRMVARHMAHPVSLLRNPATGSLVFAATCNRPPLTQNDEMRMDARLLTLEGDTLAIYGTCSHVAPTGRWLGKCPECFVWRPRSGYAPARGVLRQNLPRLFLHNYEGIFRMLEPVDAVRKAYLTAARGESLWVRNEVVMIAPGDTGRAPPIELPFGCEQEQSVAAHTTRGDVALLRASGGYQNVDRLYRLLDQPRASATERVVQLSSHAITGSFRGVIAIDPVAGRALWVRPLGVTTMPFVVADINGDGLDEFILSSYAPENGVSYSGMTDAGTAYVICLDWYGNVLWRRPFHGQYVGALACVADVRGDRGPEIIVVVSSNKPGEPGCAAVLAPDGTVLAERPDQGGFYGLVAADLDADGKTEIVTGASGGRVIALDGDLELVSSFQDTAHSRQTGQWTMPCAANDIDGDGDVEVVCVSAGWNSPEFVALHRQIAWDPLSYIVVLGPTLEEETRYSMPFVDGEPCPIRLMPSHPVRVASVTDTEGDGRNEIVLSSIGPGLTVLEVVKRETH